MKCKQSNVEIAALISCRNTTLMQRRSTWGIYYYNIILTSMHKENREKNKETEHKRSDPPIIIDQMNWWLLQ